MGRTEIFPPTNESKSVKKYSKSDQDPRQTDRDREAMAKFAETKSQHFALGTNVRHQGKTYTIVQVLPLTKTVFLHNEEFHTSVVLHNPYFMQWR